MTYLKKGTNLWKLGLANSQCFNSIYIYHRLLILLILKVLYGAWFKISCLLGMNEFLTLLASYHHANNIIRK